MSTPAPLPTPALATLPPLPTLTAVAPAGHTPRAGTCSVRPAPVREPLFDDELPARHLTLVVGRDALPLPFSEPVEGISNRARPAQPVRPAPPTRPAVPGEPLRFGRFFAQALIEVLCGRRPATQLARHVSAGLHANLTRDQARGARFETNGRNPVVRSVRIMQPAERVAELTAVVQIGARFRAVAARLEARDGQWRCVSFQIA